VEFDTFKILERQSLCDVANSADTRFKIINLGVASEMPPALHPM
jgi:hypothetical protein